MQKEQIGSVSLYYRKDAKDLDQQPDDDIRLLQEIVTQYADEDYKSQITGRRNWTAMYQLAESRGNIIEWLAIPKGAEVLELGAGCGTLASVFLKKGARVTCQEENIHYCRLNALRHEKAGELVIYAMPFAECAEGLGHAFDIIMLTGLPETAQEAERLLGRLRGHLKETGVLLLAIENKFGLKYWAGSKEPQTGHYFAGLENAGVRMYSKKELKELLAAAGFLQQEFYYPYPDHRFARDIYSDSRLPKKGELSYNIVNYEGDRILLFDEQKVFDSIIEDGQFPFFSNSYLCMAGNSSLIKGDRKTVYIRYASDRSRQYAVRTDITASNGGRVYKYPLYPQGDVHMADIAKAYVHLSRQYAGTDLKFNRCLLHTEEAGGCYAEFELIRAEALQVQAEQAASAGNLKKIFDILDRMVQYVRNGSNDRPFVMTEDFRRVFGEIPMQVLKDMPCSEVSDIDLILPNILADPDGTWHVIDYEWTFFFPVPKDFIIYRTLFFLNHENPGIAELAMDRLKAAAGITDEAAAAFAKMEEGFQRFTAGGQAPYREMVNLLERRFLNVTQLKADYDRIAAQNELLKGQGFWKIARKLKKKLTGNESYERNQFKGTI